MLDVTHGKSYNYPIGRVTLMVIIWLNFVLISVGEMKTGLNIYFFELPVETYDNTAKYTENIKIT